MQMYSKFYSDVKQKTIVKFFITIAQKVSKEYQTYIMGLELIKNNLNANQFLMGFMA